MAQALASVGMANLPAAVDAARYPYPALPPAEQRFHDRSRTFFWEGILLSALLHFVLFAFFPAIRIGTLRGGDRPLEVVEMPAEIDIPPPPARIERPAVPVVGRSTISEEITIVPTTFEENPVEHLPPPPVEERPLGEEPVFTPYEVRPEIKDVGRALEIVQRHWPPLLQEAGIGGRVELLVFIDEAGRVKNHRVQTSSGRGALDEAAVAALYEIGQSVGFRPAINRDRAVPVWIRLPIVFRVAAPAPASAP